MSLEVVRIRLDDNHYEHSPHSFVADMRSIFSGPNLDKHPAAALMALLEDLFIKHNIHSVNPPNTLKETDGDNDAGDDFLCSTLDLEPREEGKKKRSTLSNKAQKQALAELAGEIAAIEQELALLRGKRMPEALVKVRSNECLVKAPEISVEQDSACPPSADHVPAAMPLALDLGGEEALGDSSLPQHPFYTELMLSNTYVWDWDADQEKGNAASPSSPSHLFASSAEEGRSTMRSSQANNKRTRSRSSSLEKTLAAVVPPASPVPTQPAVTPPGNKRQRTRSTVSPLPLSPAPGKRAARRKAGLLWTREQLLEKITHELPSEMLDGVVMIVNPGFQLEADDDSDLEFDISALDDRTLFELQQYVIECLECDKPSSPRRTPGSRKGAAGGKQTKQRTRAQQKKHPKSQRRKKAAINTKYNFIPPKRSLSSGLAELAEVFRTEVVVKVDKAAGDSDELVDVEGF